MSEKENEKWYLLGRIAGREEAIKELYDRAAALFRGHTDKEAIEIRRYALQLDLATKQLRKEYDAKYHN